MDVFTKTVQLKLASYVCFVDELFVAANWQLGQLLTIVPPNVMQLAIFNVKQANFLVVREDWLNILTKTRVVDPDFRRQIEEDTVYTCQEHFTVEDIM